MTKAVARRQSKSCPIPAEIYDEVIGDLARYAEGLLDETAVKKRHHFSEAEWGALDTDEIVEAIEAEKIRRIRNGSAKREKARTFIVKAPDVLDAIMMDGNASPRHRVDAIKTLDGLAGGAAENDKTPGDRFHIVVNLGADTETYDKPLKSIRPDVVDLPVITKE